MKRRTKRNYPKWAKAIAVAVAIAGALAHIAGFFALSIQPVPRSQTKTVLADIVLTGDAPRTFGALVLEQALLEDTEPLLLPTQWNASLPGPSLSAPPMTSGLLEPFPPRVALPQMSSGLDTLPYQRVDRNPGRVLRRYPGWFRGAFDIVPLDVQALAPRDAMLQIRLASGGPILSSTTADWGDEVSIPRERWPPVTFLWTIANSGTAGLPSVLESTGNPDWDSAISNWLLSAPAVQKLGPGTYEIIVGP